MVSITDIPQNLEIFLCGRDDPAGIADRFDNNPCNGFRIFVKNKILKLLRTKTITFFPGGESIAVIIGGKNLEEAPDPREIGHTLCGYALQLAYEEMIRRC